MAEREIRQKHQSDWEKRYWLGVGIIVGLLLLASLLPGSGSLRHLIIPV
jgi:hypothetical protein